MMKFRVFFKSEIPEHLARHITKVEQIDRYSEIFDDLWYIDGDQVELNDDFFIIHNGESFWTMEWDGITSFIVDVE